MVPDSDALADSFINFLKEKYGIVVRVIGPENYSRGPGVDIEKGIFYIRADSPSNTKIHEAAHMWLGKAHGYYGDLMAPDIDLSKFKGRRRAEVGEFRSLSSLTVQTVDLESRLSAGAKNALGLIFGQPQQYSFLFLPGGAKNSNGLYGEYVEGKSYVGNLIDESVLMDLDAAKGHPMSDYQGFFASFAVAISHGFETGIESRLKRLKGLCEASKGADAPMLRQIYSNAAKLLSMAAAHMNEMLADAEKCGVDRGEIFNMRQDLASLQKFLAENRLAYLDGKRPMRAG